METLDCLGLESAVSGWVADISVAEIVVAGIVVAGIMVGNKHLVVMDDRFIMGTQDGGASFDIFDDDGDHTYVVCTTREESFAVFITAALNHCQSFWHLLQNYESHDFTD